MPLPPSSPPLTRAGSGNYQHTSLHRDVLDYIEALRARGDNRLQVEDFSGSPEGRLCEACSDDGLLACRLVPRPDSGEEFPAWRMHAIEP